MTSRLLTGGDALCVWDSSNYDLVHTYRPTTGAQCILSSSWNPDGSSLAACIEGSQKLLFTYIKPSGLVSVEADSGLTSCPIRVLHPRSSLKLLILGTKDKVLLYDAAKQKSKKEFIIHKDKTLTCIASNFNASFIAAGATDGSIFLMNVMTGQTGAPLRSAKLQNITSVKYSNFRHSVLGSSGESGNVALWDCNSNKLMQNFTEHNAPSTGLAFSPVNDVLFLSCGLDKRCICYDTQTKRVASTIKADHPLVSVDFSLDGIRLALGTINGKVLIYDLRSLKSPIKTLSNHIGPVTTVLYQPQQPDKPSSKSSGKLSSRSSQRNLVKNIKENLPSISENSAQNNFSTDMSTSVVMDYSSKNSATPFQVDKTSSDRRDSLIFSPIRDIDGTGALFSPTTSNFMSTTQTATDTASTAPRRNSILSNSRLSTDSIFSPLRENSINGANVSVSRAPGADEHQHSFNSSTSKHFLENPSVSFTSSPVISLPAGSSVLPSSTITPVRSQTQQQRLSFSSILTPVTNVGSIISAPIKTVDELDGEGDQPTVPSALQAPPAFHEAKKRRSSIYRPKPASSIKAVLTAFPTALDDGLTSLSSEMTEQVVATTTATLAASASQGQTMNEVGKFQEEYIRGIVKDAMEDFCSDMRRQLWHIHYDMIQAHYDQRDEMKRLLNDYAVNDSLALEIERLRQENELLKSSPFVLNIQEE